MRLALAEVYEVATFYAHFDVVDDGEPVPPPLTVRVCDSIACFLNGAEGLARRPRRKAWARRPGGPRPVHGPLRAGAGRGRRPASRRPRDRRNRSPRAVAEGRTEPVLPAAATGFDDYVRGGGYRLLRECREGRRTPERS